MKIHPDCFDTDVQLAALPYLFFARGAAQPLPDGFSFSDAFWLEYDAGMMRVLLIGLGLILVQTIVFFIASCLSCCTFGNRQPETRKRATNPLVPPGPRRAALMPLQRPQSRRFGMEHPCEHRTLKRHECRAPPRVKATRPQVKDCLGNFKAV